MGVVMSELARAEVVIGESASAETTIGGVAVEAVNAVIEEVQQQEQVIDSM